jgi:hypothetical protein
LMPGSRWHTAKRRLDKLKDRGLLVYFSRYDRDSGAHFVLVPQGVDPTTIKPVW